MSALSIGLIQARFPQKSSGKMKRTFSTAAFEVLAQNAISDFHRHSLLSIDLTRFGFFDLGAVACLLAFCSAARAGKLIEDVKIGPIRIRLPSEDERTLDFLFRSGLFSFVARDDVFAGGIELARHEIERNSRTAHFARLPSLPLQRIAERRSDFYPKIMFENDCQTFINRIHDVFFTSLRSQLGFSEEMSYGFWVPNKEMFENIYVHSGSWGFAAIQCMRQGIMICYGDVGHGVRGTLEPFSKEISVRMGCPWSDRTAILAAFVPGLTCLPGISQGRGLAYVREYVEENNGTLEFRSGSVRATFGGGADPSCAEVLWMPGVQVRIFLPAPLET